MLSISSFDFTKEPLFNFLCDIKRGIVQQAEPKNSQCWDDEYVKQLLAMVSLGYPIKEIKLIEQRNLNVEIKPRLIDGVCLPKAPQPELLILEGQESLTVLFMALLSKQPVCLKQGNSQRITQKWYYIDMAKALDFPTIDRADSIISLNSERTLSCQWQYLIDCSTPEQEYKSGLFPINQVFNFSQWRSKYSKYWNYKPCKRELIEQFEVSIINKFEHCLLPIVIAKSEPPKEAVCQIIEPSKEPNYFDRMTATYAVNGFSLKEDWEIKEKHFQSVKVLRLLKNSDFLQAVTLVATYTHRMEAINRGYSCDQLPAVGCTRQQLMRLSLSEYKAWAEPVSRGYEEAAKFLYSLAIFDASELPYHNQLVALAAILTVLGERLKDELVRTQLKQWYYCAVFGEVYTGWPERKAAKDMLEVSQWLNGGSLPSSIKDTTLTARRLRKLSNHDAAAYRGISTLLKCYGATDFSCGQPIINLRFFEEEIQNHHIFPQAWCYQQGICRERYNSIINKTPITANTNRLLGGKAPSDYLKQLESSGISQGRLNQILRTHLIEPRLLRTNDFDAFFSARTYALLELIGKAMGKHLTDELSKNNYEFNYNTVSLSCQ
ncbi:hypothetical protein IQ264_00705 [Phormidium sp. LEGE 05292]|uniref:hypothetical protein n=1 Tax=[Phormidium] sp. LEGE 05292 TaxID=767427 RepID=UPI001881AD12|nr:hypothetical protein [Phormidium sp. LEGE 05292]MBE9223996.1 hypothetical protein [Phormidium sp. LEGE 05292]